MVTRIAKKNDAHIMILRFKETLIRSQLSGEKLDFTCFPNYVSQGLGFKIHQFPLSDSTVYVIVVVIIIHYYAIISIIIIYYYYYNCRIGTNFQYEIQEDGLYAFFFYNCLNKKPASFEVYYDTIIIIN